MRPIHDGSGPLLSSAMAPSTSSVLNATTKSANQSWPGRSSLVPHVDRSHSSLATSDKEKDRQFEQYVKPSNETRPILIHSPINQDAKTRRPLLWPTLLCISITTSHKCHGPRASIRSLPATRISPCQCDAQYRERELLDFYSFTRRSRSFRAGRYT